MEMDDPGELRLVLYVFWRLERMEGNFRYIQMSSSAGRPHLLTLTLHGLDSSKPWSGRWLQTAALPLSSAQKSLLAEQASAFGNTQPPAGLSPSLQATVEQIIDASLVRAFRIACLICAGASWLGATAAAGTLRGDGVRGIGRATD